MSMIGTNIVQLLFGTGIILSNLRPDYALECYTCSSHIGIHNPMNDCERFNSYENHRKSVCMPGDQVCAKYIVNHDGMTWVHRSCRPYDICGYLRSMYRNGRDQLLECSTCSDKNLCNSAPITTNSITVLFMLVFFKLCLV